MESRQDRFEFLYRCAIVALFVAAAATGFTNLISYGDIGWWSPTFAIVGGLLMSRFFLNWLMHNVDADLRQLENEKRELQERDRRIGVVPGTPPRDPWHG